MSDSTSTSTGSTKYSLPMIKGHGDDIYQYAAIRMNFSSNIPTHTDLAALQAHLAQRLDLIGHYPEPEAWSLERLIADRCGVDARCVVVTNGATEAIYLTAQTFAMHHRVSQPTFSEYADAIAMYRGRPQQGRALWLCNPNNPTGDVFDVEQVKTLAERHDLLVLDQSYEHYTAERLLTPKAAVALGNVVQIHSLTKIYGVPGLRVGYIVTAPRLARQLRRHLRPWSVNALAIEAAHFLLENAAPIRPDLNEAQRLYTRLSRVEGLTPQPTKTNFMLCQVAGHTAAQLKDHLMSRHAMLIRDASNFRGLTPHHFRVAAQLPEENDALVAAIDNYLNP